ncbi:MAG TPA: hypothetical protein VKQ36_12045 [Ktedonobacterales bacterium]|nr:hypothetical protein [Ktedonobacterales bacterium]
MLLSHLTHKASFRARWRRARAPLAGLGLLSVVLLVSACSSTAGTSTPPGSGSDTGGTPTATSGTSGATPTTGTSANATCSSVLPGAGAASAGSAMVYPMGFPTGSVSTPASQTISGTGIFTVYQLTVCSPNTTASDVNSYYSSALPNFQHGWASATIFPYDGGLMKSCDGQCWTDPKGGPIDYLVFDQFADHGNGTITYRMAYAISPTLPDCNSNPGFSPQSAFFLPGYSPSAPLPPFSATAPDDASGGVRGFDICSPGDTASITAFMEKELAATGWSRSSTGTSANSCVFTSECWVSGSAAVSFSVTDATGWVIAWRVTE